MSIAIQTRYLPRGEVGKEYSAFMKAKCIPSRPVEWSLHKSTPLPFGLDMDLNGHISGEPVKVQRTSVQIYASAEKPHEQDYVILNINIYQAEPQPLKITTFSFKCVAHQQCSMVLSAEGGTSPYKWSCDSLPIGLSLVDGVISGVVSVSGGVAPVLATVTDNSGNTCSAFISIEII